MNKVEQVQQRLGVKADGIWGPKSQAALNEEIGKTIDANSVIEDIQAILGVTPDGQWGLLSQAALNLQTSGLVHHCKASSFADPADVVAFNKCKKTGKSDMQCFAVGDNGIGQFGDITAQEVNPMVAIHHDLMLARWGSEHGSAHRPVEVCVNGKTIHAIVADRISAPGRIDLNPACAKLLGLKPPFVVDCVWSWL